MSVLSYMAVDKGVELNHSSSEKVRSPSSSPPAPAVSQRPSFLGRILENLQAKAEQNWIDMHGINPNARDARLGGLGKKIFGTEPSDRIRKLEELEEEEGKRKEAPAETDSSQTAK